MHTCDQTRREFLSWMTGTGGLLFGPTGVASINAEDDAGLGGPADVVLRIAPVHLEIAPGRTIGTVGYNGTVPGPLIRFREGVTATVDLFNDTDAAEYVHWHGFDVPTDVDGAEEEGSLAVPAHGRLRYRIVPLPSGCRYVHTHAMSMSDLNRGAFTGQFAFAHIEPKNNPGRYDQEIFLATHEWDPFLSSVEEQEDRTASPRWSWARLLKHVFALDMARCPWCQQGTLRIIAAITQGEVIRKILQHLKLSADPPPIKPARVRQEAFAWSSA